MNTTKNAVLKAMEQVSDINTTEEQATVIPEQGCSISLEGVVAMQTNFNDAERPVQVRNIEYIMAVSDGNNQYVRMMWEFRYLDLKNPEWRSKKGVTFDGQGQLLYNYHKEFGISEEDTYIVRSKKVKGNDGREFSQWVTFCHIDAYDEAA